ncbi:MAG TPA: MotA/TolQ/ExbB proton channel family protein [Myxococcales bacterium]|nr:transporter [Deltaproteobacteria bacterium]HAA59124.1 MotA/TolQ/ExbB proton channel family protein [Myxococcales bacterium]|tara:strand:- start:3577 stop:4227 length:651 start_codon:yes stop_codon:yes gene_type:complete
MSGIYDFYFQGGAFMHPIAICLIFGIGLMVERFIFLFFRYNINGAAFMAQIQKLVMANNIDRAIKLCNAAPSAALPKVVKAGLTRANKGEMEIANAIEEATLEVIPKVQKRTNLLQAVANVATMLGLLGTIFGLIEAFKALDSATADQKSKLLAKYISIALNTTAFGLVAAIPCLVAHAILSSITKKIIDEIDEYTVKLQNLLFSRAKGSANPLDR